MYKVTTPTLVFTFPSGFKPNQFNKVILTFSANKATPLLEKNKSDLTIDTSSVTYTLTQAETLLFPAGRIYCQINFVNADGSRIATEIQAINVINNLHNQVI